MRQIVLDTETTGLDPKSGHKIIEIAALEMVNRRITGDYYHQYINPLRDIERDAAQVHGITNEMLQDKPVFKDIVNDFLSYVKGAELIIHNAPFDVGFINVEMASVAKSLGKIESYCQVTDTLKMARQLHMGQRNSLDALCKRYGVDNSNRDLHGALIDSELLAKVYLAMTGGQGSLFAEAKAAEEPTKTVMHQATVRDEHSEQPLTVIYANETERKAHQDKLAAMGVEVFW